MTITQKIMKSLEKEENQKSLLTLLEMGADSITSDMLNNASLLNRTIISLNQGNIEKEKSLFSIYENIFKTYYFGNQNVYNYFSNLRNKYNI
jgi:YHS domain-containing protein